MPEVQPHPETSSAVDITCSADVQGGIFAQHKGVGKTTFEVVAYSPFGAVGAETSVAFTWTAVC